MTEPDLVGFMQAAGFELTGWQRSLLERRRHSDDLDASSSSSRYREQFRAARPVRSSQPILWIIDEMLLSPAEARRRHRLSRMHSMYRRRKR